MFYIEMDEHGYNIIEENTKIHISDGLESYEIACKIIKDKMENISQRCYYSQAETLEILERERTKI